MVYYQIQNLLVLKTIMGSGDGQYSGTVNGLSPNSTYYAKAYAKNSAGESYGLSVTFTTTYSVIDNEGIPLRDC